MYRKKPVTNFLCPKPSFILGLATVLNVRGSFFEFNYSDSEEEADFNALKSDWAMVGQDICNSMESAKKELRKAG
jgi:hypothetical protein